MLWLKSYVNVVRNVKVGENTENKLAEKICKKLGKGWEQRKNGPQNADIDRIYSKDGVDVFRLELKERRYPAKFFIENDAMCSSRKYYEALRSELPCLIAFLTSDKYLVFHNLAKPAYLKVEDKFYTCKKFNQQEAIDNGRQKPKEMAFFKYTDCYQISLSKRKIDILEVLENVS